MRFPRLALPACLLVVVTCAFPAPHAARAATIQPDLEIELSYRRDDDPVSVILFMSEQAPIAQLDAGLKTRRASLPERHFTVVNALREASRSQTELLAALSAARDRGDVEGFTSYWIANLIVARVTKAHLLVLAEREDIARIEPNFAVSLIAPVGDPETWAAPAPPGRGIGVTPGQRAIHADRVWYELGLTGAGTLVANCDSGVDGTHPALAGRWRGAHGHPASECWLDLIGSHPTFPYDANGHGTHVMGSLTGLGAATGDTIGVAWNALWIATDAIQQAPGAEFDNDIIAAFQWFADPDGNPATTDDVPDVVQNSWGINESFGYEDCDSRWWDVIDNCEAAGVVTIWSAGNEGALGAQTLRSPADRATTAINCLSVGAVDATHYGYPWPIGSFSSLGPTGCIVPPGLEIKPEVCAPGVEVYSSVPGGGYAQTNWDGTSMAGPHVAGIVALMREADPDLEVDTIKQVLLATARDHGDIGEDNTFGWGVVDAYEAVLAVTQDYGRLEGLITNASNGNTPIAGATINVLELGRTTTSRIDGTYTLIMPADTCTVTVSHPSFTPQTTAGVAVESNLTTQLDVELIDIAGPVISGTSDLRSTEDPIGPYAVSTTVMDQSAVADVVLRYRVNGGALQPLMMAPQGAGVYSAAIPGQPQTSHVEYYVRASDVAGNESTDPPGAPGAVFDFWVAEIVNLYTDTIESGAGAWTHAAVTGGFADQWHVSTERNHTTAGARSWKCGDTGTGTYIRYLDAGLVTPVIELTDGATLRYWQWIEAEVSPSPPGYAYDGGLVEISADGGPWVQIFPNGDYPYRVRGGALPGPFPGETPLFSGSYDWHEVVFDLAAYNGPVRLRFRFGSNGGIQREGWHVDDITVDGFRIDVSATGAQVPQPHLALRSGNGNPFTASTTLAYDLPQPAAVALQVFDLGGRLVRTLVRGEQAAGSHQIRWDGRNEAGRPAAAGVYLARLRAGAEERTAKLILTR